jgi:eukaryotic-like serine/threonine-protein kinase
MGGQKRFAGVCRGTSTNIVLMALRKEPERRYPSVEQFSEDIRRHLNERPVHARTETFSYRSVKFIKRHRVGVSAATLVVLTLCGGIATTTQQARRAERRFKDVRQLANSFIFEIHDAIKDLPGSTPARELVVLRALQHLDSLAQEETNDVSLKLELAAAYQKVGDVQSNDSCFFLCWYLGLAQK